MAAVAYLCVCDTIEIIPPATWSFICHMMTENSEKENEPQNRDLQRSPGTVPSQPESKVSRSRVTWLKPGDPAVHRRYTAGTRRGIIIHAPL